MTKHLGPHSATITYDADTVTITLNGTDHAQFSVDESRYAKVLLGVLSNAPDPKRIMDNLPRSLLGMTVLQYERALLALR